MKTQITILLLTLSNLAFSQVVIGSNVSTPSAILEFGPNDGTAKKGIILPIVNLESNDPTPANGTILMDKNSKKIKAYQNNQWIDLSDEGSFSEEIINGVTVTTAVLDENTSLDIGEGVIIGSETSNAEGVLVLESEDKALILPRVADPHLNIPKPVAGTMCYDTTSDSVAIFDGKVWSYWK